MDSARPPPRSHDRAYPRLRGGLVGSFVRMRLGWTPLAPHRGLMTAPTCAYPRLEIGLPPIRKLHNKCQ